jgi:hypothetical protein
MAVSFYNRTVPLVKVLGITLVSIRLIIKGDPETCLVELSDYTVLGAPDLDADIGGYFNMGVKFSVAVNQAVSVQPCTDQDGKCKKTLRVSCSVTKTASAFGVSYTTHVGDIDTLFVTSCSAACCS